MEFRNFRDEVGGKAQALVDAYEPGQDEFIDNIPGSIDIRNSEIYAVGEATGYGKPKRKDVDIDMCVTFRKLKSAEYSCQRVLIAHMIGRMLNEYDKRLSKEPMTWKDLQHKMGIAFNWGPNDFQDMIRGAIELGYRAWYADMEIENCRTTRNTAGKWKRRGPKKPNLILLPTKEETLQYAKEG